MNTCNTTQDRALRHVTVAKSDSSHVAYEQAAGDPGAHVAPVVRTSRAGQPRGLRSRDCNKSFLSRWKYRRGEFRPIGPRQAIDASPFDASQSIGNKLRCPANDSLSNCAARPCWQLLRARSLILRGISSSLVLGACKIVLVNKRHIPRLRSYRDEGFGSV
jgi:hypothetical protein